jgi:hypothetical protein
MNKPAVKFDTHDIVVDEVFPHTPETIWKALTTGELIARWLMPATGFEPVEGNRFTYKTTPAGAWDGTPGKVGTRQMSVTARGWKPWSRGRLPVLKTARVSASSIPVSSCRRTTRPTGT